MALMSVTLFMLTNPALMKIVIEATAEHLLVKKYMPKLRAKNLNVQTLWQGLWMAG